MEEVENNRRVRRILMVILLVMGVCTASFSPGGATRADAAGSFDNGTIADVALRYVGAWGGTACRDAGRTGGGQCKSFVNCVVWMAGRVWPAPGYHTGFQNAGGVEVSASAATKGDVIQVGNSDNDSPLHTAIVVANLGGGRFDVVDSNWAWNEVVSRHSYTPPSGARFWRLGTVQSSSTPDLGYQSSMGDFNVSSMA